MHLVKCASKLRFFIYFKNAFPKVKCLIKNVEIVLLFRRRNSSLKLNAVEKTKYHRFGKI